MPGAQRMETPGEVHVMKRSFALFLLLIGVTVLHAQQPVRAGSVQQKFSSGGTIRLHLESGGYIITPANSENIVITCHARSEEKLKEVRVAIKALGTTADVYVRNTPNNNFTATIEVPRRSNLWVRLTAGELNVGNVEGDKDLELNAGSLRVAIPRPQEYGQRDASVTTGSIEASAFDVSKDGLFRSFSQQGPGKYRLHAHVIAGEIALRGGI
jgi:hypothetical protein